MKCPHCRAPIRACLRPGCTRTLRPGARPDAKYCSQQCRDAETYRRRKNPLMDAGPFLTIHPHKPEELKP